MLLSTAHLARGAAGRLLDLALPPACGGCGTEGAVLCPRCLRPLAARSDRPGGTPLGLPSDVPAPLLQLEWYAPFAGPVRRALHALKYGGERRLAVPLGAALAARWRQAGAGGDLLVPVSVHAERARDRGYDQAVLLADAAASSLAIPAALVLERGRATVAHYHLDRSARAENVAGAFRLRDATARRIVAGGWVVLVDDIVTTGATLAAGAEALLAVGAGAVSAVTVARER